MQIRKKILFIDRDGTLIIEPEDKCVDQINKLDFIPGVIPALLQLKKAGFEFVMVTNQDGLGSEIFPYEQFSPPHDLMLKIFASQGIHFPEIRICPHMPEENCECRKPKIGLVLDYLQKQIIDLDHSYVIGDRETDLQLAKSLGIKGLRIGTEDFQSWEAIVNAILQNNRTATIQRNTYETKISAFVDLDRSGEIKVNTGIGFFDHMLEQLAKHGGFSLKLSVSGDLHIDEHHTVEDTALTLGEAIRKALSDKRGIHRYGFLLPMDEALAQVAVDLSGRPFCVFRGKFDRERVGELATELIPHFFQSFAQALQAAINIEVTGENSHHMVEAVFKAMGRALRQAFTQIDHELPTTKGVL